MLPERVVAPAPLLFRTPDPASFALASVVPVVLAKVKLLAEVKVPVPVITPPLTVRSLMVLDDVPTASVPVVMITEFVPKVPLAPKAIVPEVKVVVPL